MIRLRRHTDGRVALSLVPDRWKCFDNSSTAIPWSPKNEHVSGPGWSELLVAELPEPDATLSRAAQLWALLHNNCSPVGRWTDESRRYYTQIAAVFDRDRTPTQDAYDAACAALHKHRDRADRLEAVLTELVALKDGARDDHYRAEKDATWECARRVLAMEETT